VCRTDLQVVDGELTEPTLPLIPGHQIVGEVVAVGARVEDRQNGERVGEPCLGWTCGVCDYCRQGREKRCDRARFTGYAVDGAYAEYTVADSRYYFPIPHGYPDDLGPQRRRYRTETQRRF
jgi:propanol-preferring alcohol dehydrogenase